MINANPNGSGAAIFTQSAAAGRRSITGTAESNERDPEAKLRDVLRRMSDHRMTLRISRSRTA